MTNEEIKAWNRRASENAPTAQPNTPTDTPTDLISRQPDYDLSGYSDRLWKSAYERGKAEAQRTGRWIFGHTLGHSWMKCSECLVSQDGQTACFSYCPNCGARMEEQE